MCKTSNACFRKFSHKSSALECHHFSFKDPDGKRENQGSFGPGDNNRPDRTKDGQWELRRCGSTTIRHPYICKKPSNQDPILCQNGFEPKAGSCWKILNVEMYSYENAKKVCRSDHKSYLAEILNDDEQQGWDLHVGHIGPYYIG